MAGSNHSLLQVLGCPSFATFHKLVSATFETKLTLAHVLLLPQSPWQAHDLLSSLLQLFPWMSFDLVVAAIARLAWSLVATAFLLHSCFPRSVLVALVYSPSHFTLAFSSFFYLIVQYSNVSTIRSAGFICSLMPSKTFSRSHFEEIESEIVWSTALKEY